MPRGNLTVPEKHQKRIAIQTLRMSEIGAHIAGGPSLVDAIHILRDLYGYNDLMLRNKLKRYGHAPQDINRMLTA